VIDAAVAIDGTGFPPAIYDVGIADFLFGRGVRDMAETPDTVHGRLLESVHISGYTFERACGELEWLLDKNRWRECGRGYKDINAFLATIDFSEFRVALEQRKKLAKRLADLGAGQRATAKLIGVGEATIGRDKGTRKSGASSDARRSSGQAENTPPPHINASSDAPDAWFQVEVDPTRAAKQIQQRAAKEEQREARREDDRKRVSTVGDPLQDGVKFPTIVFDPPWDWSDEGDADQLGRARPTYATMTFDQLVRYPIPQLADQDCHLYLWISNRSLPKGFALLDVWGFRYVTCLTWCKPSIGMGNYFRGSTEHVLFAIRGSQPLKRKDVGTWFEAERGPAHSAKPAAFYTLIESCSPGPYLDLFGRTAKGDAWKVWPEP
jgi:N6-adenosine-specific RNA methylase IME4